MRRDGRYRATATAAAMIQGPRRGKHFRFRLRVADPELASQLVDIFLELGKGLHGRDVTSARRFGLRSEICEGIESYWLGRSAGLVLLGHSVPYVCRTPSISRPRIAERSTSAASTAARQVIHSGTRAANSELGALRERIQGCDRDATLSPRR